jgi:hypothetical protein
LEITLTKHGPDWRGKMRREPPFFKPRLAEEF